MRWIISALGCWIMASHLGCHHSCGNPFPMQGMSRVPPPATGSFPAQGGYYNAPMGMQSSFQPEGGADSTVVSNAPGGFQSGGVTTAAGFDQPQGQGQANLLPGGESYATNEMSQAYGMNPGNATSQPGSVTTAGGSGMPMGNAQQFQSQSNPQASAGLNDSVPSLQWQQ